MKVKSVAIAAAVALGASAVWASDPYTVTLNGSSSFGAPNGSFSASGDRYGFSWSVPLDVQLVSFGGAGVSASFALPSFTIAANSGWQLSGDFTVKLGDLSFTEVGGATTNIIGSGKIAVDGGAAVPVIHSMTWTITSPGALAPNYVAGFFADSLSAPLGTFSSLTVSEAFIDLSATGGSFANILSTSQSRLEFSFTAVQVPVPEPETYAMLLSGIAVIGWVARRRRRA